MHKDPVWRGDSLVLLRRIYFKNHFSGNYMASTMHYIMFHDSRTVCRSWTSYLCAFPQFAVILFRLDRCALRWVCSVLWFSQCVGWVAGVLLWISAETQLLSLNWWLWKRTTHQIIYLKGAASTSKPHSCILSMTTHVHNGTKKKKIYCLIILLKYN